MAGIGPPPKAPGTRLRARQTARSGAATWLAADAKAAAVPALPTVGRRKWHDRTIEFWTAVWTDPVSAEFANSDTQGLVMLAELVDAFWKLRASHPLRIRLMTEIRMQGQRWGLSPLDRRRLQIQIERGSEAQDRTNQKAARRAQSNRKPGDDPRKHLAVV